ncbi:hypothetical protein CP982_09345 [Streptomyces spectabilis]|uniref:Uncharacterized protein n=1 Tax=Streptomyces spectabilis TaxID=68270 RepID=A0A5P2X8K1_STRST|nr:hypothetical protein CP982_09345 [Streptomyces spectabilis]
MPRLITAGAPYTYRSTSAVNTGRIGRASHWGADRLTGDPPLGERPGGRSEPPLVGRFLRRSAGIRPVVTPG